MHTGGVSLLVAVAYLRAAFYRVNDRSHALLQTVLDRKTVWPGHLGIHDLLQPARISVAGSLAKKHEDVHREDLHHVAHGEVQGDNLIVVLATRELERQTRLE